MTRDGGVGPCSDSETGELLAAYEMGLLEPDEQRRVERHLTACPACADTLLEMAPYVTAMSANPADLVEAAPAQLRTTLLGRVIEWFGALRRRLRSGDTQLLRRAGDTADVARQAIAGAARDLSRYAHLARLEPLHYRALPTRGGTKPPATRLFEDGAGAYAEGRHAEASSALRASLDADRNEPALDDATRDQAHLLLGVALLLDGQHRESVTPLERAAASSLPVVADRGSWYLAQASILQGEMERATTLLRSIAGDSPAYADQAAQQLQELELFERGS